MMFAVIGMRAQVQTPEPQLLTPGRLAAELGEPLHRIQYVLSTRRHIRPAARAGQLRLYQTHALGFIRRELRSIDARRAKGSQR